MNDALASLVPTSKLVLADFLVQTSRRGFMKKIRMALASSIMENRYIGTGTKLLGDQTLEIGLGHESDRYALLSHAGYLQCVSAEMLSSSVEEVVRLEVSNHLVAAFPYRADQSLLVMTQIGKAIHRPRKGWKLRRISSGAGDWGLELHLDWVGGCPKNRNVLANGRWCQLQDYIRTIPAEAYRPYRIGDHLFWAFTKVLAMKNLQRQKVRIVATYENQVQLSNTPDFYAANRKDWEPKRILSTYLDHSCNDDTQGNLGFEAYQRQNFQGIQRH